MTAFLIIGGVGVALLLIALIIGDHLDGALDAVSGGLFSTEAVSAFIGAFGFAGAIAYDITDSMGLSVIIGLVLGVLLGAGAGWVSAQLRHGNDHATVRTNDLLERNGTVISEIPEGGFGTVSLSVAGQVTRLNAKSSAPVPAGTTVTIVSILSPTSVQVEPLFLP
ncbi:MAG: hypothetical protein V9G04_02450 [Nocardioides sp.]